MCIVIFREGKGVFGLFNDGVRPITLTAGEGYLSSVLRNKIAWLQLAHIVPCS
jgi:hypothetical protein